MNQHQPPPAPQRLWDDADRAAVLEMLKRGMSAGQVAEAFNITRNAAIGRITRDKELHRHAPHRVYRPPKRKTQIPWRTKMVEVAREEIPEPPDDGLIALFETGTDRCKWPVAMARDVVGGILCCGCASLPCDTYCPYHRNLSNGNRL